MFFGGSVFLDSEPVGLSNLKKILFDFSIFSNCQSYPKLLIFMQNSAVPASPHIPSLDPFEPSDFAHLQRKDVRNHATNARLRTAEPKVSCYSGYNRVKSGHVF